MLAMKTKATSLEDQVTNLTKLIEGLSTSLNAKDHKITKLMNKLESMNKGDQTSVTKDVQVNQLMSLRVLQLELQEIFMVLQMTS
jgi:predicted RNase H-like nuclease (RuvC/YqgF family)